MTKNLVVVTLAILAFGLGIFLKESRTTETPLKPENTTLPRLVDLGSDTCIPCKQMAPILKNLKNEYTEFFVVEVIDIKKNPEAGRPYKIRVIPTQIFIDASGTELFRHEGFMAKESILNKWRELGIKTSFRTPSES